MIYNIKNELGRTYLIAGIDFKIEDDYRVQRMTEYEIYGLLPLSVRVIDGEKRAYYDITDKISFTRKMTGKEADYGDLKKLATSILRVCDNLSEYLLDESNLIVEPDLIFADALTGEYEFIYIPANTEYSGGPREDLMELMNFLISCLSSDDHDAVKAGYAMYELASSGSVSLRSLYEKVENSKETVEICSEDDFSFEELSFDLETDNEPAPTKYRFSIKEFVSLALMSLGIISMGFWAYLRFFYV